MAKALGRKQNTGRNGFSRHTYVGVFYAPQAGRRGIIEQFPQDILADSSVPFKVVIVRSDRGGRFRARNFGDLLCRSRGIMEELPMASSPQFSGVAERALGLVETAAMAGQNPASELFPGAQLPAPALLWAEASRWACDALNRTATTATPESKLLHGTWYDIPPPVVLLPFLTPGYYCKVKRDNKSQAKAHESFFSLPLHPNHP